MRYFDAFAGYGGFSLGIEKAYAHVSNAKRSKQRGSDKKKTRSQHEQESVAAQQPTCIGYSEIDKYAIQIYEKHFPEHKNYGDITKINASELPDFDLFVGGFPCQAFSIAGKRKGFDDTRGTLFFDIARILRAKRPRLLLLENVKGLLSHDNGQTFSTIISTLDEIGYDLQWQVLNAKYFGVPQNRERVFIVGHLGGFRGRQVFPIGEGNAGDNQGKQDDSRTARTVSARFRKGVGNTESRIVDVLVNVAQAQRIRSIEGLAQTLSGLGGGQGAKTGLYATPQVRRLTPTECERLMGLPDGWTEGVSDTQRYKLCGNGVVVNVVEEIMKRIIKP